VVETGNDGDGAVRRESDTVSDLDVPIGDIEKVLPTIVVIQAQIDLNEWAPLRPFRLSDEMHPGFLGRSISLLRVARDAGTNDVFPGSWSSAMFGDDVIQV